MLKISAISTAPPTDNRTELEKEVFHTLEKLNIHFERVDHEEAASMEACVEIEKTLGVEIRKNIFLCNRQKTEFYLLVMPAGKPFVTKDFSEKMGCSRLSFAPAEQMQELLGTTPGSATVMAMLHDQDGKVKLVIEREVAEAEWFGCNPGKNTSHIKIKTKDLLEVFLAHTKHAPHIIAL